MLDEIKDSSDEQSNRFHAKRHTSSTISGTEKKKPSGKKKIVLKYMPDTKRRQATTSKRSATLRQNQIQLYTLTGFQSFAVNLPESKKMNINGTGLFENFDDIPLSRFIDNKSSEEIKDMRIRDIITEHINQNIDSEKRANIIDPSNVDEKTPIKERKEQRFEDFTHFIKANVE